MEGFWLGPIFPFIDGYYKAGIIIGIIKVIKAIIGVIILSFDEETLVTEELVYILDLGFHIIIGSFYNKLWIKHLLEKRLPSNK